MSSERQGSGWHVMARQLYRYVLVGALTNLAGYLFYLLLTYCGLSPKLTITLIYTSAALVGFFANRRFTFQHDGRLLSSGFRYIIAQISGYLLNLLILVLLVDRFGVAHQIAQGVAIVVVATFLFVLSRYFVFTRGAPKAEKAEV